MPDNLEGLGDIPDITITREMLDMARSAVMRLCPFDSAFIIDALGIGDNQ